MHCISKVGFSKYIRVLEEQFLNKYTSKKVNWMLFVASLNIGQMFVFISSIYVSLF